MDTQHALSEHPVPPSPSRDDPARAPWGPVEIVLAILLTLAAALVIFAALGVLVWLLDVPTDNPEQDALGAIILVGGQLLLDVAAVVAAYELSIVRHKVSFRAWGLRRERPVNVGACVAVLVAAFVTLIAYSVVVSALGFSDLEPRQEDVQRLIENRSALPFSLLLVVVAAPITEEMFFRGFVFNGLRRKLTMPGAAVLSGLAFSAIHVSGADYVGLLVPFAVIGFMFAMLVGRTGSLWNSILVHLCFNLFGFLTAVIGGGAGVLAAAAVVAALLYAAGSMPWERMLPPSFEDGVP